MKIITGNLKGRTITTKYIKETRPTMNRVKESLVSLISLEDSVFVDLFAGTGGVGFEALSNNAKTVIFNDREKINVLNIKKNLEKFNIHKAYLYNLDYRLLLKKLKKDNLAITYMYLDPPYKSNIQEIVLNIEKKDLDIKYLIIETNQALNFPYLLVKHKNYSDKSIYIYKIK